MTSELEQIFTELVERHGGRHLTMTHRAIIRRLAVLLTADEFDVADARLIATLEAMLPAPVMPQRALPCVELEFVDHDIQLLDAAERAEFERLRSKCYVTAPPSEPSIDALRRENERLRALIAERERTDAEAAAADRDGDGKGAVVPLPPLPSRPADAVPYYASPDGRGPRPGVKERWNREWRMRI